MTNASVEEFEPVQDRISEANEHLNELQADLHAIDLEFEKLSVQGAHYELLGNVCQALDELSDAGAAELFWDDGDENASAKDRVSNARQRISDFGDRIASVEARRESLLEDIRDGQEVLDILEDDLFEIQLKERERQAEWVVERELDERANRSIVMPWARRGDDDQRFHRTLAASLAVGLLLGLIIPLVDIPILQRDTSFEVPERFAELIREEPRPVPPAPEPEPQPVEPEPVEPEPIEPVVAEEPILAEETPVEVPEVVDEPAPAVVQEEVPAEERARTTGILAFRESFANMATSGPSARLGSAAQINDAGEASVGRTERSMVTTDGPGSSGGINLASLSRDLGGGGEGRELGGVELTRVSSSIGGSGMGTRPLASGASAGRTDEEIQIVFDRYKAALYRLYNRQLRNDPTLRGQVVLQLTIEPDGSVSACAVQASDMNAPVLEQQVVERVLTFDFGAKEVPAVTILYPIDFLPAA